MLAYMDKLNVPGVLIAAFLAALGSVFYSPAVSTLMIDIIPDDDVLAAEKKRAISEGADPELCDMLDRGKTAVVATLQGKRNGARKVVAFRFDIDSNEIY